MPALLGDDFANALWFVASHALLPSLQRVACVGQNRPGGSQIAGQPFDPRGVKRPVHRDRARLAIFAADSRLPEVLTCDVEPPCIASR